MCEHPPELDLGIPRWARYKATDEDDDDAFRVEVAWCRLDGLWLHVWDSETGLWVSFPARAVLWVEWMDGEAEIGDGEDG